MFNLIDLNKLGNFTKEELEYKLNANVLQDLEFLLNANMEIKLFSNSLLLEYQNTNFENYQFIMKDFINEVNKSSSIFIRSVISIFENFNEIILEQPTILNHNIKYNKEKGILETELIKEYYCNYLNELNVKASIVRAFLKRVNSNDIKSFESYMQFDRNKYPEDKCLIEQDGTIKIITKENIFQFNKYQSKREAIVLNMGEHLKNLAAKHKDTITYEEAEAINFFSYKTNKEHDSYLNDLDYSINLFDENIINKKSQVFFYNTKGIDFEFVGDNIITAKKKSIVWTYTYEGNFNIEYYIRKYLIETYTKKDMFSYMCLYKDFLSNYVYINYSDKNMFNQNHPMIKEANLLDQIEYSTKKFKKRLNHYRNEIEKIRREDKVSLIITKSIREWVELLSFADNTKKFFYHKFMKNQEPTIDEFLAAINEYGNRAIESEVNKILDTDEKNESYKEIKKVLVFQEESINEIFNRLYYIDTLEQGNELSFDVSRFFNSRDKATFHTTLKDSIVFDNRLGELMINDSTYKYLDKSQIARISDIMHIHKYHDYIEVDPVIAKNNNEEQISIDEVIAILERTNKFDIFVPQKCALKFRKLGKYKASGIYFSFSKQLGLDHRGGRTSYIHEMAHHIDLNTNNDNRRYIVNLLNEYFRDKITTRKEYYLKSEELIARAAEISLMLLLGRYYQYKEFYDKQEISEETLLNGVIKTFRESKYNLFMDTYDGYMKDEYINIQNEILNKNFQFLETLLTYFKAFWSGKEISGIEEKKLSSNVNVNYTNENRFSKKSDYSYKKFYRRLFKERIKF